MLRSSKQPTEGALARGILDALPAAVLVFDPERRVRYANPLAAHVLGTEVDVLLANGKGASYLALGLPSTESRSEQTILLPDGRKRRIGLTQAALDDDTIVVFRDISEIAVIRAERDRLLSLAAIGEALPSFVHELKNSLAGITTLTEVMIEELPEGDTTLQLHSILTELRRMKLSFDGIGAVHRELRSRGSNAIDFAVREVCRVLRGRAAAAGVSLRSRIEDMPLLPLEPSVVRAIVLNFVSNALHACGRDGTVVVYSRLIEAGSVWELVVSDSGVGMSPTVLERCTDLFFSTKQSGSGIGLALCRRAIEGTDGTLELRSVPGFGTTVTVRVPVDDQEE